MLYVVCCMLYVVCCMRKNFLPTYYLRHITYKTKIAREEKTDIIHPILKHPEALYPHAKGKPLPFFRVYSYTREHLRMHHPRAHDFYPPRTFAQCTAASFTFKTFHIHLYPRLHKWKKARAEAHLCLIAKKLPKELLQSPLQMRKRDVLP